MKRLNLAASAVLASGVAVAAFANSADAGSRTPDQGINHGVGIQDVRRGINQLLNEQLIQKRKELIDAEIDKVPITHIHDHSTTNIEEQQVFQPGAAEALSIGNWIQNSCNGNSVSNCVRAQNEDSDVRAQTADERGPGDLGASQGNTSNENGPGDVVHEDRSFNDRFDPIELSH